MTPTPSDEKPHDDFLGPFDPYRVYAQQTEVLRKRLEEVSRSLANADPSPNDGTNVEAIHIKQAADLMLSVVNQIEDYSQVGATEIFISFAAGQAVPAAHLRELLQANVFRCFLASDSIELGKRWNEEIMTALRVCKCFIPIITSDWVTSKWCSYEFGAAAVLNKLILPIVITGTERPPLVGDYQTIELASVSELMKLPLGEPTQWNRFVEKLSGICPRPTEDSGRSRRPK